MGKSPDRRASQRAGLLLSQQPREHFAAAGLSQSHRSCGELQFSCRLGLQATSADHVIGFRVVGHVENRATFPVTVSLGMKEHCTDHYKEIFLTRCQVPSALGEITLLHSKNADGSNR